MKQNHGHHNASTALHHGTVAALPWVRLDLPLTTSSLSFLTKFDRLPLACACRRSKRRPSLEQYVWLLFTHLSLTHFLFVAYVRK